MLEPSDGMVVYGSSGRSDWGRRDTPIQPGATSRQQELLIRLPDTNQMKAACRINEQQLTRLRDAYPPPVALLLEGDPAGFEELQNPRASYGALLSAARPIRLPSTEFRELASLAMATPSPALPEMTLRAAGLLPPMMLEMALTMATPAPPLGTAARPEAERPMRLPRT